MSVLEQYEHKHPFFSLAVILSLSLHLLIVIGFYLISNINPTARLLSGPVYTVNLVDMPARSAVNTKKSSSPPTAGSVSIPNPTIPKPVPASPKDLKTPKIKEIDNLPVISPITPAPKPTIKIADSSKPRIQPSQGLPGKENVPGGPVLGAVKGASNSASGSQTGADQGILGANIPGAIPFPDPNYLQIIQNRITQNWNPPQGVLGRQKQLSLMVFFTIDRKGKISNIEVEETSGSLLLDQSSVRAVKLTDPLPPIPSVVKEDLLRVHFRFTYTS